MRIPAILFATCLLGPVSGIAQTAEETKVKVRFGEMPKGSITHEIGINSTFFIANFISFSGNIPNLVSPYALHYKMWVGRHGLRVGLGANFREQHDDATDNSGGFTSTTTQVDARIGYEFQLPLARRWNMYFGADLVYQYALSSQKNNTGFATVETSTTGNTLGGGPVLGIQFFINERISLGTETTCYFESQSIVDATRSDFQPTFDSEQSSSDKSFSFIPPTSIFVNIRFAKQK
jgi:hypothetical protein